MSESKAKRVAERQAAAQARNAELERPVESPRETVETEEMELGNVSESGAPVHFLELELEGFGVFAKRVSVSFPARAGVYTAPNEAGKSTLLYGLAAVLFGLPESREASRLGTGRFRSFGNAHAFRGRLVFAIGPTTYRLERNFETHRVLLSADEAGRAREIFAGEHNPGARSSAGKSFAAVLRELLGLSSLELFQETVFFAQPSPTLDAFGEELQHLLSGSRLRRMDDVRQRLFQQIKALTKATGDLGIVRPGATRAANQSQSGRIESLEEELRAARQTLSSSAAMLESLHASDAEAERLDDRGREIADEMEQHETRLRVLRDWLKGNEERRAREQSVRNLKQAREELDAVAQERREAARELQGQFPNLGEAPEDLAALLEALEQAATRRDDALEAELHASAEREALEAQLRAQEADLEREHGHVRGRGDLLALHERAHAAHDRQADRRQRIEGLTAEEAELKGLEIASVGLTPASAERELKGLIHDATRLEELDARAAELEAQAEGRAFLETEGGAESLREKHRLEADLRETSTRLREARGAWAAAGKRRELAELALRAAQSTPGQRSFLTVGRISPLAIGIVSVAFGVSVYLAQGQQVLWALVAAGGSLAVLLLLNRFLRSDSVDAAKAADLEALVQEAEAARLAVGTLETQVQELKTIEKRQDDELASLKERLGGFAELTADELATLGERWRQQDDEERRVAQERRNLLESRFGLSADGAWPEARLDEVSPDLRTLIAALAQAKRLEAPTRLWAAVAFAREFTARDWTNLQLEHDATTARDARLLEIRHELDLVRTEDDADSELDELLPRLEPFSLETTPEELQRALMESRAAETEFQKLRASIAALPPLEAVDARVSEAKRTFDTARAALVSRWPAEVPAANVAEWARNLRRDERPARDLKAKLQNLDENGRRLLALAGAPDRESLETRFLAETAALGAAVRDLETLESKETLLSAALEDPDPIRRAKGLAELEASEQRAMEQLTAERAQAEKELHGRLREKAGLEGRAPSNVAQLELSIPRLEEELGDAQQELSALKLAYEMLGDAATEFQGSYREDLESKISERFQKLTGRAGRRVSLGNDFALKVVTGHGRSLALEQLSQGTRDQLGLALRLALADFLAQSVPLPLLLDDPFVHFDAERRARARESLAQIAEERQWLLVSHDDGFHDWADPIDIHGPVES